MLSGGAMNERNTLLQRQELLEQAARLQRAIITVRMHTLQQNRVTLIAGTALSLLRRIPALPRPLMLAWGAYKWLTRNKR